MTAVRAYQLLPVSAVDAVGRALPMVEIVVGVCLVLGLLTRISAAVSALLLLAFIIGIASVWSRGILIDCGCFGDGKIPPRGQQVSLGDRQGRGFAGRVTLGRVAAAYAVGAGQRDLP